MIYFIRSYNEYIKIGTSTNVDDRLKGLQTASPKNLKMQAVLEGSYTTESGLHELFKKSRVRGECFKYTEEIKWFIRAIQTNPDMNNIYSLYRESQKMRITAKAKRLGKNHKLSRQLEKNYGV